jgi:hypothetical protein
MHFYGLFNSAYSFEHIRKDPGQNGKCKEEKESEDQPAQAEEAPSSEQT